MNKEIRQTWIIRDLKHCGLEGERKATSDSKFRSQDVLDRKDRKDESCLSSVCCYLLQFDAGISKQDRLLI